MLQLPTSGLGQIIRRITARGVKRACIEVNGKLPQTVHKSQSCLSQSANICTAPRRRRRPPRLGGVALSHFSFCLSLQSDSNPSQQHEPPLALVHKYVPSRVDTLCTSNNTLVS